MSFLPLQSGTNTFLILGILHIIDLVTNVGNVLEHCKIFEYKNSRKQVLSGLTRDRDVWPYGRVGKGKRIFKKLI